LKGCVTKMSTPEMKLATQRCAANPKATPEKPPTASRPVTSTRSAFATESTDAATTAQLNALSINAAFACLSQEMPASPRNAAK
jgi:hypothetical protein